MKQRNRLVSVKILCCIYYSALILITYRIEPTSSISEIYNSSINAITSEKQLQNYPNNFDSYFQIQNKKLDVEDKIKKAKNFTVGFLENHKPPNVTAMYSQYCSALKTQIFSQRSVIRPAESRWESPLEDSYNPFIRDDSFNDTLNEDFKREAMNEYGMDASTSGLDLPDGCAYRNHNIHTDEIICSGSNMTEIPLFSNVRRVNSLIFYDTRIQVIDKGTIRNLPRVKELAFYNGVLIDVSFDFLIQFQEDMTTLSIINNRMASFSFSKFNDGGPNENQLATLNFQNNLIVFLPQPPVEKANTLPLLRTIILNQNPMCVLPGDLFYPLRESPVVSLHLHDVSLFDIGTPSEEGKFSPLEYLKGLEDLDLSANPQLPMFKLAKFFSPLQNGNLTKLNMAYNNYIEIPTEALRKLESSLVDLNLQGSSIKCLNNASFPTMINLKVLNLKFSRISLLLDGTFNSLPSLEVLQLDGNNLTMIPAFTFPKLKVLTLEDNPTEDLTGRSVFKIGEKTFVGYSVLEELSLSQDPLHSILKNTFAGLKTLLVLKLRSCSLSTIEVESFLDLQNLQILDLSDNAIKSISRQTFKGLLNLQSLDLSSNKISFSVQPSLPAIPIRKRSLMDRNQRLPKKSRKASFVKSNELLRHSPGPTEDYLIKSLPDTFLDLTKLETVNLADNSIQLLFPELFKNLKRLKFLDLSYNRIKSWDTSVFTRNTQLQLLLLVNNGITRLTSAMVEDFSKPNLVVDLSNNLFSCSCSLLSFDLELNETIFLGKENYTCFNGTDLILVNDYVQSWELRNYSCDAAILVPTDRNNPYENPPSIPGFKLYGILIGLAIIAMVIGFATYRNRWYVKYLAYKIKVKVRSTKCNPELGIYEYDTFVCYSHTDRQWVFEKLVSQLETTGGGLNVCVHERDFLVGEEITHNIIRSVEMSRKVIVVISHAFVRSAWCMFELQMASNKILDERKNKLILLLLEPIEYNDQPKELKLLLKSRTYVSWVPDLEGQRLFWARLKRAISKPTSMDEQLSSESSEQAMRQSFSSSCSSNSSGRTELDIVEGSDSEDAQVSESAEENIQTSLDNNERLAITNMGFETSEILSIKNLSYSVALNSDQMSRNIVSEIQSNTSQAVITRDDKIEEDDTSYFDLGSSTA